VFAHPLARRRGPVVSDEVVAAMATAGLVGIEVDHPDHDEDDRAHAAGLAADLGLVPTGSSDYHGTNKTTRLGQCTTTAEAYERLLSRPTARRPID
jgi:sugar phosphate isomerase/epimerase